MIIKENDPIFSSLGKIKYSARRGMLELDILLAPYLDNCYLNESKEDKKLFVEFLTSEDNDMFDWLFKGVIPPVKYKELVKKIVAEKHKYNTTKLV
ncbi:UNVERIFIED_CONTAM: hypothetical protein GTU68_009907 [Idotea baltica]|uniref:FAD assembly factor SdhE n=1 Tax=Francisella sp. Scap27 TaxID=2589986 RepID=UPI0015C1B921|nr:succinate dehydrogenase assembly factor 2 [Francisella sp. Scap27]MCL4121288.1 hypothetical protein [Idotea baltica]QLE78234.1 succinate dehydrogenase assembly factor 2 [Francisella sp. Scap27]